LSALSEHINSIQAKLQQLLKQYELLQKENSKQLEMISGLQNEQLACKEQLLEVQQQNLILKASVTEMNATDKKALEQKIQHYIKNIDKCISLLSQ
jgi:chromosome segregation ATPase